MANHPCASCKLRAKYDRNPRSLVGRLWHWHAGWCPGFRSYMSSLPEAERREQAEKYSLSKYR